MTTKAMRYLQCDPMNTPSRFRVLTPAVVYCCLASSIFAVGLPNEPRGTHDEPHAAQPSPGKKLYPRDDSASVPSFAAYKRRLLGAAERGEMAVLRDAMAARIRIGFELEMTPEEAVKHLGLKDGTPWTELRDALKLGAVREPAYGEDTFIAPYVAAAGTSLELEDLVITGRNVNVRAAAAADAKPIDVVSYDVVSRGPKWPGPEPWEQIVTPSGKVGFVHSSFVRSVDGERFRFRRIDGEWKLASFLVGE